MATTVSTVVVLCSVYMVFGASVYQQADIKTPRKRDTRNIRRTAVSTDSTFETENEGRRLQKTGNPVFNRTIYEHNGTFLDSAADNITFQENMKKMYELREKKWRLQKDTIVKESKCDTSIIYGSGSVEQFYNNTIMVYTREKDCIYKSVNAELRHYRKPLNPSNGSYALTLNVILSQWKTLEECTGITYHGVNFSTVTYTVNTVFTWTGFTSSSENKKVACGFGDEALFTIDNSAYSDWRPKRIAEYSYIPSEAECLYPATAIFKVIRTANETCENSHGKMKSVSGIHISLQRGETQGEINGAAIVGRSLGGVAYLALIAVFVVM